LDTSDEADKLLASPFFFLFSLVSTIFCSFGKFESSTSTREWGFASSPWSFLQPVMSRSEGGEKGKRDERREELD